MSDGGRRAASSSSTPTAARESVSLGERGFYVADVPAAHLAAVHRHGLLLVARDDDGERVAQAVIPTDAITPPTEAERPHDPIELDTVSDGATSRWCCGCAARSMCTASIA